MASTFSVQLKQRNPPITHTVWTRVLSRTIDRKYLLQTSLVFAAYVVAGKLGQATANIRSSNLGPVWPAYGVALAAILICGYRVWLGVAAGAFLVAFFSPVPHLAALGQAAGSTVAAVTGAFLLYRIANFNASLSRLSDALSLIAIGGFGSAMVSASIGMLVLYSTHVHPYSGWGAAWLIYWLGDATGVLLVTPLLLTFPHLLQIRDRDLITELAVLLSLLTVVCFVVFSDVMVIPARILSFIVLPFVMWAAIRFGVSATALSMVIVASVATIETALGSGPFARSTTFANAVLLDAFFGVLSVSGLSLAAVIEEREHAEHERERVISEKAIIEAELHANERIRESEERLRLATQAGKMFAYSWDAATDAIERSGEAESILGIESDKVATGAAVSAMIHPADRDRVQTVLAKLTVESPTIQVAYRIIRPDGQVVWLERHSRAYFDERGKLKRIIGMIIDLTERKKAEEALRASEERLRLAQQAARLGTFERDVRSGRITWAEGLEPLYGLPRGSLDGKTTAFFKDLIHLDDWEQAQRAIQEAMTTGQPTHGEWRAIWPDGSVHYIASRWQVLMDESGQPSQVVGVNMDVTEHKLAEDALRNSEERLRLSQWAAHIGTFDVNLQTGVDIWQPETEALYGLPPGSFGGTLTAFEDLIHPDDRQRITELTQEMMRTGQPAEAEWRVIWPDGSIHWITGRGQVLMDESGKPSRMLGVNMDVTQRKQAEEALADMTRKLIDAQEQERARIARELHDDINQRLALLSVELEASGQNPPDTATDMSMLLTELRERISEISWDVQSLSHQLHSSQLEYLGIVAAASSFCREFSASQNVEVDFNHDDIPRSVPQDISLCLFRVLQEALHNAVKYSKVRHFEVRLSCSENRLSLTVSDRGVGFDPESALSRGGLGLTSMKERVRLINGTISIESKPMNGTSIHVRVPLTSEHDSEELAG